MADSLREKFLGDETDDGHRGKYEEHLDSLRRSLANLTDAWQSKKTAARFLSMEGSGAGEDNRGQWRKDLGDTLECTPCHVFIVSLLLIDLLATAVDILKTITNKTHDLNSCSALLEGCQCVSHFERTETWEFMNWISIGILSILALNILLLSVAFGLSFFRHPSYVLDAFVTGTALGLEIFLDSETAGLLIIPSLWRIVRVAHGIFEVADEAWEKEIKQFEKRLTAAESIHESDQELLQEKDQRIAELEGARGGRRWQQDNYGSGAQHEDNYGYGAQPQDDSYGYGGQQDHEY